MTPIPIIVPMHSAGVRTTDPVIALAAFLAMLLVLQYAWFVVMGVFDMFNNRRHALLWLIPGWPLVELALAFIDHFKELE